MGSMMTVMSKVCPYTFFITTVTNVCVMVVLPKTNGLWCKVCLSIYSIQASLKIDNESQSCTTLGNFPAAWLLRQNADCDYAGHNKLKLLGLSKRSH